MRPILYALALLCTALPPLARAQTSPVTLSYAPNSQQDALLFDPTFAGDSTRSASPYPFRTLPSSAGSVNFTCPDSGAGSSTEAAPGTALYNRCFKAFPQYFDPITPSSGGYVLRVRNCKTGALPVLRNARLEMVFDPTLAPLRLPITRVQYSVDGGSWNTVPFRTGLPAPLDGWFPIKLAIPGSAACINTDVTVKFRLRLEGTELADNNDFSSNVSFRVQ